MDVSVIVILTVTVVMIVAVFYYDYKFPASSQLQSKAQFETCELLLSTKLMHITFQQQLYTKLVKLISNLKFGIPICNSYVISRLV